MPSLKEASELSKPSVDSRKNDAFQAKGSLNSGLQQTAIIDSRLAEVQLSPEARGKLAEQAIKLREELEKGGQKLDRKLHGELQKHTRELEGAVARGKIDAGLIKELEKTVTASREVRDVNANEWAESIKRGSMVVGSIAAAPVIAIVAAAAGIIRGVMTVINHK